MKLHELHVGEAAAGLQRQVHPVAGVLVAPAGAPAPQAGVPPGRQHHGVGQVDGALPGVNVEGESPEAAAVVHQEARDVAVFVHRNAQSVGPVG